MNMAKETDRIIRVYIEEETPSIIAFAILMQAL